MRIYKFGVAMIFRVNREVVYVGLSTNVISRS
jgi:hypothetical protein